MEIIENRYCVKAIVQEREDCTIAVPALDFLKSQYATNKSHVAGMKQLFSRFADKGRAGMPSEIFHVASSDKKIFRLSKGQLRIYCFMDGNNLVLTHGSLKKTQKTDKADIEKAENERKRYFGGST